MRMFIMTAMTLVLAATSQANAADAIQSDPEVPVPQLEAAPDGIGIWGAIAFSSSDGKHGMFWGADKRAEAEANALKHCQSASGSNCELVQTFRNHRHWNDNDGTFPYNYCAALAVDPHTNAHGVSSARSISTARAEALQQCQGLCKIVEQGCT